MQMPRRRRLKPPQCLLDTIAAHMYVHMCGYIYKIIFENFKIRKGILRASCALFVLMKYT